MSSVCSLKFALQKSGCKNEACDSRKKKASHLALHQAGREEEGGIIDWRRGPTSAPGVEGEREAFRIYESRDPRSTSTEESIWRSTL
jgi:hypothetical protein